MQMDHHFFTGFPITGHLKCFLRRIQRCEFTESEDIHFLSPQRLLIHISEVSPEKFVPFHPSTLLASWSYQTFIKNLFLVG